MVPDFPAEHNDPSWQQEVFPEPVNGFNLSLPAMERQISMHTPFLIFPAYYPFQGGIHAGQSGR